MTQSAGIHHITAIARDAARNLAFYTRILGLRLVKKTVNFDDPGTYHLYYGDEDGQPGTILTFFPWADMPLGRHGSGEAGETAFVIPESAVAFWLDRLTAERVTHDVPARLFGETVIRFEDPDGMRLALVARSGAGQRTRLAQQPQRDARGREQHDDQEHVRHRGVRAGHAAG